jgi:hypothetical protein
MLNFKSFCYLQNQKTGSSFVEAFLRNFSNEPVVYYEKHAAVPVKNYNKNKFYFINVRLPLNQYWSLFNYGLDGKGEIYFRLLYSGYGYLYQNDIAGFDAWLSFVSNPKHSRLLHPDYTEEIALQFGFMTWRFLRLACLGFQETGTFLKNIDQAKLADNLIVSNVIKTENLRADLKELVLSRLSPYINNTEAALNWLEKCEKINVSKVRDKEKIQPTAIKIIKNRESYLYNKFYEN